MEFQVRGGAGPAETAAVLAAIMQVMAEQAASMAQPPRRPEQGSWVVAGRPRRPGVSIRSELHAALPGWSVTPADAG